MSKTLRCNQLLKPAKFEVYYPKTIKQKNLILDIAALQNLAVLEVNDKTLDNIKGSLIGYLDKTSTPFGKRLMKNGFAIPY